MRKYVPFKMLVSTYKTARSHVPSAPSSLINTPFKPHQCPPEMVVFLVNITVMSESNATNNPLTVAIGQD